MKFIVEIKCDNAAFEDYLCDEVARILQSVRESLTQGGLREVDNRQKNLRDFNGNIVGKARWETE